MLSPFVALKTLAVEYCNRFAGQSFSQRILQSLVSLVLTVTRPDYGIATLDGVVSS